MIALKDIIAKVADARDLSVQDIKGAARWRDLAQARQEIYWLAHHHTNLSYANIGRLMGRHHTTVTHGVARVFERLSSKRYQRQLDKIEAALGIQRAERAPKVAA